MSTLKLEGVDTLSYKMERRFGASSDSNSDQHQIEFSVESPFQDDENKKFGYIVTTTVTSNDAVIETRLGLRYSGEAEAWDSLTEESRLDFMCDVLLPDSYPYVRSLVQFAAGPLGTTAILLSMLDIQRVREKWTVSGGDAGEESQDPGDYEN